MNMLMANMSVPDNTGSSELVLIICIVVFSVLSFWAGWKERGRRL